MVDTKDAKYILYYESQLRIKIYHVRRIVVNNVIYITTAVALTTQKGLLDHS